MYPFTIYLGIFKMLAVSDIQITLLELYLKEVIFRRNKRHRNIFMFCQMLSLVLFKIMIN